MEDFRRYKEAMEIELRLYASKARINTTQTSLTVAAGAQGMFST